MYSHNLTPPHAGHTPFSNLDTLIEVNDDDDDSDEIVTKPKKICRANVAVTEEKEPILITIFKWSLIILGFIMLCIALFIMGDVIYSWSLKYNT